VVAFKYTQKENWDHPDETNDWVDELRNKPIKLNRYYKASVTLIRGLVKKKPEWMENINNVFKAGDIEGAINRALHKT